MADYKELLRRAVDALPENNGAARRAVYEKARAALVGQLRAINPPLAARDITAHRLQLEDCIRQVEQEASETAIAGMSHQEAITQHVAPQLESPARKALQTQVRPQVKAPLVAPREGPKPLPAGGSIEEIIAAANAEQPASAAENRTRNVARPDAKPMGKPVPKLVVQSQSRGPAAPAPREVEPAEDKELEPFTPPPARPAGRPIPSIVARAEAAKSRTSSAAFGAPIDPLSDGARRGPVFEPRREATALHVDMSPRGGAQQALSRQVAEPAMLYEDEPVPAAMSAVREVEVEAQPVDPQGAIDRAIATLDREARGDEEAEANGAAQDLASFIPSEEPSVVRKDALAAVAPVTARAEKPAKPGKAPKPAREPKAKPVAPVRAAKAGRGRDALDSGFPRARAEEQGGGISAVTVFLIVFAVLLAGAGGAGFWAWREGYIDLDSMFSRTAPVVQQAAVTQQPASAGTPEVPATGPGNTNTPAETPTPAVELKQDDRLAATPAPQPTQPLQLVDPGKTVERLAAAATETAEAAVAAVDPANLAGSQSLLLEASDNGTTGAVPFSGTVDWSKGTDERGMSTLIGKANIPARNLGVDVLIRKNSDPSLPASHLMEINFRVSDSFIGGSIAGLPGVLLKNEELVQGAPLVGASARVVGNSFLFALSAAPADIAANNSLLTGRKWMDLALIYATGKRAIITLEKDATAEAMFRDVVAEWMAAAN